MITAATNHEAGLLPAQYVRVFLQQRHPDVIWSASLCRLGWVSDDKNDLLNRQHGQIIYVQEDVAYNITAKQNDVW